MFEDENERPHPLYPKPEQQKTISLYPPRQCQGCDTVSFEVEWYEIVQVSSESENLDPGSTYKAKSEMKKLCKRCHGLESYPYNWG